LLCIGLSNPHNRRRLYGTDRDSRTISRISCRCQEYRATGSTFGSSVLYGQETGVRCSKVRAGSNTSSPLTIPAADPLRSRRKAPERGRALSVRAGKFIALLNEEGRVATRTSGAAAGQIVPFGGTIVGTISDAISASTAESRGNAKRAFERHKLKFVELEPAGKMTGSAFLPDLAADEAPALVVSYGHGNQTKRLHSSFGNQCLTMISHHRFP